MGDVGKRSVVMGDVGNRNVGDDSVVIGATHPNGCTYLTGTMAIGSGAKAGPGSISIGYQAGAGLGRDEAEFRQAMADLEVLIIQKCNEEMQKGFELIKAELSSSSPNKGLLKYFLTSITLGSSLDGATDLIAKVMSWVDKLPK